MPRKPRVYLAGVACHVIQRGNDRQPCFYAEEDYQFYLDCLYDACTRYHVSLHAYVLMTNHVHLLMTPETSDGVSRVMQSIGRRYVQYVNVTYRRSGTLWEGRHKSSLVDEDNYLLSCYRYIEMNPVRAGMVNNPADYKWSSYLVNAFSEKNASIIPHVLYLQLGVGKDDRLKNYREMFSTDLDKEQLHALRTSIQFSMPVGDNRFVEKIEDIIGRKIGYSKRGRPSVSEEQGVYIVW